MAWDMNLDVENHLTGGDPPDPPPVCKCQYCGCELYLGDDAYEIDGDLICDDCAKEWLDGFHVTVDGPDMTDYLMLED